MRHCDTAVIGGGAAGILAAISAARRGKLVVILERMKNPGRKILASGNGRCNFLNDDLDPARYNPEARQLVRTVFGHFGKDAIQQFFADLGLAIRNEGGRLFPATNQAQSVLTCLMLELERLKVPVKTGYHVTSICSGENGYTISANGADPVSCATLVIAGGGKTYPALGSDGSTWQLARKLGHAIIDPVPVAVPLTMKDRRCHALQGQRLAGSARALVGGKMVGEAAGDILFTAYGLSGTAIIDISEPLSIAFHRGISRDLVVSLDLVPFMTRDALTAELTRRRGRFPPDALFAGILPDKCNRAFKELCTKEPGVIATGLKDMRFPVTGTRGWNEADFTAGGIDLAQIEPQTLGSRLRNGLYFAGEILNVHGARGGYNLAWAWASGYLAGQAGHGHL